MKNFSCVQKGEFKILPLLLLSLFPPRSSIMRVGMRIPSFNKDIMHMITCFTDSCGLAGRIFYTVSRVASILFAAECDLLSNKHT